MHMVHSIINGNPVSPVNLGGGGGDDDEEDEEEGDDRRKHKHRKLTSSPQITSKGKMNKESKDNLIKKIMAENAKLAKELGKETS